MHITMIDVISLDGKLTKGSDPDLSTWTSAEDKIHFHQQIAEHNLLVMGRTTYENRRGARPDLDKLCFVLTHHPEMFRSEAVEGKLEFTSESPQELTKRLEQAGHSKMLLFGGGQINAAFLAAGLVNELLLTIEPVIFGSGTPLVESLNTPAHFNLVSLEKLNDRGTILLRYRSQKL